MAQTTVCNDACRNKIGIGPTSVVNQADHESCQVMAQTTVCNDACRNKIGIGPTSVVNQADHESCQVMAQTRVCNDACRSNTGKGPTSVMRPKSRMQMRPSAVLSRLPGCGSACSRPVSSSCTGSNCLKSTIKRLHMYMFEDHDRDLQKILENVDTSSSSKRHLK